MVSNLHNKIDGILVFKMFLLLSVVIRGLHWY